MKVTASDVRSPADRLAALRRSWWSAAGEPGEAFGYVALTSEYQTLVDAWFAELGTYLDVLEQLPGASARPAPVNDPGPDPVGRLAAPQPGRTAQQTMRLDEVAAGLNPLTAPWRIAETVDLVSAPPPGDPVRLRHLAEAFERAAAAGAPLAGKVDRLAGNGPPDAWHGAARHVWTATSDLVAAVQPAFDAAAGAVRTYADAVEDLQRRHEPLRLRLREAWRSMPQQRVLGFTVTVPDLGQLPRLAAVAKAVLEGCRQVYRECLDAAEELSRVLGDVTAQARSQQARRGGLPPATAVLVANTGILSVGQLRRATDRRKALTPADRARFDAVLDGTRSADKRAYLLEAFAAGHSVDEVTAFGAQIRDLPPIRLHRVVNLVEPLNPGPVRFGAAPVMQLDRTCAPTSMMLALAAADPIFALSITAGLDPDDRDSADAFLARLRQAEDDIDNDANHRARPPGTPLSPEAGTTGANQLRWMNDHADAFGTRYTWRHVGKADPGRARRALRDVIRAVTQDYPVLLNVGDDHLVHAVLVVGHRGGDLLIYEPAHGAVTRANARDFLDGAMTAATNWQRVYGVILPT